MKFSEQVQGFWGQETIDLDFGGNRESEQDSGIFSHFKSFAKTEAIRLHCAVP